MLLLGAVDRLDCKYLYFARSMLFTNNMNDMPMVANASINYSQGRLPFFLMSKARNLILFSRSQVRSYTSGAQECF